MTRLLATLADLVRACHAAIASAIGRVFLRCFFSLEGQCLREAIRWSHGQIRDAKTPEARQRASEDLATFMRALYRLESLRTAARPFL